VATVAQRRRTSARLTTLWPQMATLDSLPGDQRAVLQLVLGRGRSYDEIAGLLTIGREAVRARALAALDALGPQTRVADADRQMICDYLLGQLPDADVPAVRERLAHGAGERAWARVLSAELLPVASGPLPEIPSDAGPAEPESVALAALTPAADDDPTPAPAGDAAEVAEVADDTADQPPPPLSTGAAPEATKPPRRGRRQKDAKPAPPEAGDGGRPRSSRRGGIVVIALAAIIVVVVVLVLVLPGGPKKPASSAAAPATTTSTAATTSTPATGTSTSPATVPATGTSAAGATGTASTPAAGATGTAQPSAQINLTPTQAGSKAEGIADVLKEGSQRELAIVAQGLPPNTAKNSYEVWLYNSPTDAKSIGFGPVVGSNGKLAAAGALPTNASHFKQLIVTVETTKSPTTPGPIVMQGQVTGLS
jgi:Sigma-70, region 4